MFNPPLSRRRFVTGSLATGVLAVTGHPAATYKGCSCGVAAPITGPLAAFGEQIRRGADLAVKDLKSAGFDTELILRDDTCNPSTAVRAAEQFISDKVVFVFGHFCSSAAISASTIYERAKIVHITLAAGLPGIAAAPGWKYSFRIIGSSESQSEFTGRYLATRQRGKKIAIVFNNSPFGKSVAETIKASMNANGLHETMFEQYPIGAQDFSNLVSQMKTVGIEAFYVTGPSTEAGLIVRQARQLGLSAQMISGNVLAASDFWRVAGENGEGTLMISNPDPRFAPEARAIIGKFKENNFEPEGYTLYAYAGLQLWAQVAERLQNDDPTRIAEAFRSTEPVQTVIGRVAFDERGELRNPRYAVYEWRKGTYAEVRTL
jgi:branched-chain amino acid transport system substrate-binding protein